MSDAQVPDPGLPRPPPVPPGPIPDLPDYPAPERDDPEEPDPKQPPPPWMIRTGRAVAASPATAMKSRRASCVLDGTRYEKPYADKLYRHPYPLHLSPLRGRSRVAADGR